MWFIFALITTFSWGLADIFYKKGADENDRYSHLKTSCIVGIIMGIHAIYTIISKNISYDFRNMLVYLPVSFMYILSMTIGYFGLKYLELSISSPVQNSSGMLAGIMLLVFLKLPVDIMSIIGNILIFIGIMGLGIIEKHLDYNVNNDENKKYKIGFVAFFIPIIYGIIDALGTFFDGYYLNDYMQTPLINVTKSNFEDVANISYEFTFLFFAILIILYVGIIKKQKIIDDKLTMPRGCAAILETIGQATYVYALSNGNSVIAAPLISSYCVFSVIFSRIFLKEKLTKLQYLTIITVCAGILIIGIAEEL